MSFFSTLDEQPRLKVLPLNNSNSRKLLALDGHDPSCGERIIRARVYALAAAWCGFAAAATAVAALLFPNRSRRSLFPPSSFSLSLLSLYLSSLPLLSLSLFPSSFSLSLPSFSSTTLLFLFLFLAIGIRRSCTKSHFRSSWMVVYTLYASTTWSLAKLRGRQAHGGNPRAFCSLRNRRIRDGEESH